MTQTKILDCGISELDGSCLMLMVCGGGIVLFSLICLIVFSKGDTMTDLTKFSAQFTIALTEAQSAIGGDGTLIEKLKTAMLTTRDHWMCTDENEQFKAAVGAVMLHYGQNSDEFVRLEREMKSLNKVSAALNAAQAGVSVDFNSILDAKGDEYEPLGLLKLWRGL